MSSRPPDRFGRPWGHPDYGADPPRPPDMFGRPWGDPNYGADPPAAAANDSQVIAQIVKRLSVLEKQARRTMVFESGGGNMSILGGANADFGATEIHTSTSFRDLGQSSETRDTVTKKSGDTDLLVVWWLDAFRDDPSAVTPGTFTSEHAVQVDSTDYGSWPFRWNVTTQHLIVSGFTAIAGIGAGSRAIELRTRNLTADKALVTNTSSHWGWLALEVPGSLTFN